MPVEKEIDLYTDLTRSKVGLLLAAAYLLLMSVFLVLIIILPDAALPLLLLVVFTLPLSSVLFLFQATGSTLVASLLACAIVNAAGLYFMGVLFTRVRRYARRSDREYFERFL
jgi:hypothetical protein